MEIVHNLNKKYKAMIVDMSMEKAYSSMVKNMSYRLLSKFQYSKKLVRLRSARLDNSATEEVVYNNYIYSIARTSNYYLDYAPVLERFRRPKWAQM